MTQDAGRHAAADEGGRDQPQPSAAWWSRPGGSPWDVPASAPAPGSSKTRFAGEAPAPAQDTISFNLDGERLDTLGRIPAQPAARRPGVLLVLATVAGLLAGLVGGTGAYLAARELEERSVAVDGADLGDSPPTSAPRPAGTVAGVASKVLPSVVQIRVQTSRGGGTGSGFVIDDDGFIVTNNHVIQDAIDSRSGVSVTFEDGTATEADIVGASASYDLAVLKISARNLKPLPLGNSDAVAVGDSVLAVGSPLGLSGTVTSGIVSAKDRPVTAGQRGDDSSYINAIQTDAAINPGNSGGPLVNLSGEVIGVNSVIATLGGGLGGESGNIGVGFAIPINQVKRTTEQIIDTGEAQVPIIGASLDTTYQGDGALITRSPAPDGTPPITPGGPADDAGLEPGDVIVAIDGKPVGGSRELIVAIRSKSPRDRVVLTIRRGNSEKKIPVTLGASPG